MRISVRTHDGSEERLIYAEQIGADGASISIERGLPDFREKGYASRESLEQLRERFERHNLILSNIDLHTGLCLKNQLFGLPGRDREIENLCRTIQTVGEVFGDKAPADRPAIVIGQSLAYWYFPHPKGHRMGYDSLPTGRGGAILTDYDANRITEMDAPGGEASREQVWDRTRYLYERIVPVAEQARIRLATHPNDPPVEHYRGFHHALVSFEGFKKFIDLVPSPYNGLLVCIGCFIEMGEDTLGVLRYFGERRKIFHVHFRNIRGRLPHYEEVFQDEGDLDMVEAARVLGDTGYDGFLDPDHSPGLIGDSDWRHRGIAWQVGYIRGVVQALRR